MRPYHSPRQLFLVYLSQRTLSVSPRVVTRHDGPGGAQNRRAYIIGRASSKIALAMPLTRPPLAPAARDRREWQEKQYQEDCTAVYGRCRSVRDEREPRPGGNIPRGVARAEAGLSHAAVSVSPIQARRIVTTGLPSPFMGYDHLISARRGATGTPPPSHALMRGGLKAWLARHGLVRVSRRAPAGLYGLIVLPPLQWHLLCVALFPISTSRAPRNDAWQRACSGPYAWDLGAQGSPALFANPCPCRPSSSRRSAEAYGARRGRA